jgi:hypothetical protein
MWPIYIVKALPPSEGGYHWNTGRNQPYSVVELGVGWTVAASHELCLTGDTRISLLNGTEIAIKDLVGLEEFYVYSCNEKGDVRSGRGHSARLTRKNAEIVKITLDNGECIRCTNDHRFLMRDGSYLEAGRLSAGDSLMPMYRRKAVLDPKKTRKGMTDYEQVWNPRTEEWLYTHRMVIPYCSNGYVRHHKDFNRFNNSPTNIEVMKWDDHQKLHADHISYYGRLNKGKKKSLTPEQRVACGERGRATLIAYNKSKKHREDMVRYYDQPGIREKHGEQMRSYVISQDNILRISEMCRTDAARQRASKNITNYNKSEKHRAIAKIVGKKNLEKLRADPDFIARQSAIASQKLKELHADENYRAMNRERSYAVCHRRWHVKRGMINPDCHLCVPSAAAVFAPNNHKVVSVISCGREDCYDITVDKYYNFATTAGVFVHNCEMIVDPHGNRLQSAPQIVLNASTQSLGSSIESYLVEVCDPTENLGYTINGIAVSDFITPNFYLTDTDGLQYCFTGNLKRPMEILFGGYISWLDPTTNDMMQITWLDPSQPPALSNLGSNSTLASLKEHVDNLTQTVKALAHSTTHPAVKRAMAMGWTI